MIIGQRLQERITSCGTSQKALARRVKLSQSTINGLVHGGQASSTKLHEIARELQTTPAYLTGETDDPSSELPHRDVFFSDEERDWVELLRSIAPKDRKAALQLVRSLAAMAR